jgi:plastocyanin
MGTAAVQEVAMQLGDYFYEPSTLTIAPGEVRLVLTNGASRRHSWNLQDRATGADLVGTEIGARQEQLVTFTAPAAGTYRIYCNITDHAERGHVGTLIVAASRPA